jgi:hypothetical protein
MSFLLNDGSKCKDVINGLMHELEICLSSSCKVSPLYLIRKLQMKGGGVEFSKHVTNHDHPLIVRVIIGT